VEPVTRYKPHNRFGETFVKRLLLAAVLACAPGMALAADFSGAWTINANFASMGVTFTATCTLTQDASGKLAGPCKGPNGEALTAAGAVTTGSDGKTQVEFGYDTSYQGTPVHLDYKSTPQADGSLAGSIETGGPEGTFTAKK
jgi:hypothetical protein